MRNIDHDAEPFHLLHGQNAERRQAKFVPGQHAAADLVAAVPRKRHHAHAALTQVREVLELSGNRRAALNSQHQPDARLALKCAEFVPAADDRKRAALRLALEEIRMAVKIVERRFAAHVVRQPDRRALDIRRIPVSLLHTDVQIVFQQRFSLFETRHKRVAVQVKISHHGFPLNKMRFPDIRASAARRLP